MNNFVTLTFCALCVIFMTSPACTLEKEPDIPTGATNQEHPVFAAAEVISDASSRFIVKAQLSNKGILNIIQHGWVWGDAPGLPHPNSTLVDMGPLMSVTFSTTEIKVPKPGILYYFRPFVRTAEADTIYYGEEVCHLAGFNFIINTDTVIFQGADVQFTNTTLGNYTWFWDFGDGHNSSNRSPLHRFETSGDLVVRLTTTVDACTMTKSLAFKVVPDPFKDYWVSIPGGSFMMGCTDEQKPHCENNENPVHQVTVDSFFMGKTEITQGQWQAVLGYNPNSDDKLCSGPDCPVNVVSWNEVVNEFIPALNRKTGRKYRLPSEGQWEYAARGGQGYKYAGSDTLDSAGWYSYNSLYVINDTTVYVYIKPVAQKKANGFGLFDMSGNVAEWVEDGYHPNYVGAPTNGATWTGGLPDYRVSRGGSYASDTLKCRVAYRSSFPLGDATSRIGFRLVSSF